MEIENTVALKSYELKTTEGTLYLTAVRFSGGYWCAGPSSMSKTEVMRLLDTWEGVDAARIFAVQLPLKSLPGG